MRPDPCLLSLSLSLTFAVPLSLSLSLSHSLSLSLVPPPPSLLQGKGLSEDAARGMFEQLLEAVAYLHDNKVVHR